ncbi:hypothetical protein [Thalassobacillus pellis]|uniref:hypothetical protein n=1 Tax=Thalassobacillus pellis TaxID=748008 RepID=UPI001961E609|nr:hypothetical protein [Thalassobacillus pellis]MBM7553622.1 hypothetical protein [Thalassobacillus pellis]
MNKRDGRESLLIKQLLREYMQAHLEETKEKRDSKNNSFVFLENSTLNMLLIYLLMQMDNQGTPGETDNGNFDFAGDLENILDERMDEDAKAFEEIISILKEA